MDFEHFQSYSRFTTVLVPLDLAAIGEFIVVFTEEEWGNITSYLVAQIREYCAKHSIDKEDFAKRLGVSSRVLTRFYSKKIIASEKRNNRLLSSLEFFKDLASALEMDVVRLFTEIQVFSKENNPANKKNIEERNEDKLSKIIEDKLLNIYKNYNKKFNNAPSIETFLTVGLIMAFIKKSSFKIIMNIIENDDFDGVPIEEKEVLINKIKLLGTA